MKRNRPYEVGNVRGRGRARVTWNRVVEKDMRECGLNKVDAQNPGKMEMTGTGGNLPAIGCP